MSAVGHHDLLAYRHSRYVLATVLVMYGVITNEPILVLAVAIALTRLYQMYRRQARPGAADLVGAGTRGCSGTPACSA